MNEILQKKYLEIIIKYKNYLENLNKELKNLDYNVVFNEELLEKKVQNLKTIIVMDNPGDEENQKKKYLVGKAGKAFNKILEKINLKRENLIILNKTSFYTTSTNDLMKLYKNQTLKTIFLEEQKFTFNIIKELSLLLNLPIMVHGFSAYLKNNKIFINNEKSNRPLYVFFNNLYNKEINQDMIYFYMHSSYGNLAKQLKKYEIEKNITSLTFSNYLEAGKEISKNFFNSS